MNQLGDMVKHSINASLDVPGNVLRATGVLGQSCSSNSQCPPLTKCRNGECKLAVLPRIGMKSTSSSCSCDNMVWLFLIIVFIAIVIAVICVIVKKAREMKSAPANV